LGSTVVASESACAAATAIHEFTVSPRRDDAFTHFASLAQYCRHTDTYQRAAGLADMAAKKGPPLAVLCGTPYILIYSMSRKHKVRPSSARRARDRKNQTTSSLDEIGLDTIDDAFLVYCWANLSPRDRTKILAGSPKTLWLFGAGASHHYDLNFKGVPVPLANDFFEAFNSLPTSAGLHAYIGPFISFLRDYKGVPSQMVPEWRENIEDFMTSVETGLERLRARRKTKKRLSQEEMSEFYSHAMVFTNMNFIFASVVNESQNGPPESAYRYLLDFCGPDDGFITFNWDTLLDRALAESGGWSPNDGYGLRFRSVLDSTWKKAVEGQPEFHTSWKLLKLHGSTNWLVPYTHVHLKTFDYVSSVPGSNSIFLYWQSVLPYETYRSRWRGGYVPTCYCFYPPNIPGNLFTSAQLSAPPGKTFVRIAHKGVFAPFDEPDPGGVPASPLLVTPVRQKKYDLYEGTLDSLWIQASKLLETADKVMIVGYSFPPTDTRVRELLAAALKARPSQIAVEVVSPDANDIVRRIGETCLAKVKTVVTYKLKFEDFIRVLAKDIPDRMRTVGARNKELRDWVMRLYVMNRLSQR
jgi:hypothetical protein